MIALNILENTLSALTELKVDTVILLSVPLSTGDTAAILVASGKIPVDRLSLIAQTIYLPVVSRAFAVF